MSAPCCILPRQWCEPLRRQPVQVGLLIIAIPCESSSPPSVSVRGCNKRRYLHPNHINPPMGIRHGISWPDRSRGGCRMTNAGRSDNIEGDAGLLVSVTIGNSGLRNTNEGGQNICVRLAIKRGGYEKTAWKIIWTENEYDKGSFSDPLNKGHFQHFHSALPLLPLSRIHLTFAQGFVLRHRLVAFEQLERPHAR